MDMQKCRSMICNMIHPNVTTASLTMYAKRMAKSPETLCAFLEESCKNDIFKTAVVVHRPLGKNGQMAKDFVHKILVDRCKSSRNFSPLDLLAIVVYKDQQLLRKVSVICTDEFLAATFALTDINTSCSLLRMSLANIPKESCTRVQNAFCGAILENNSRLDSVLPELLPLVLEHNAANVLSTLIEIAGVKKIAAVCGEELFRKVDSMIRSGMDSVPLWEAYFDNFFSQPHTPEELLVEGLWHLEMYAGEEIFNEVGSVFYLYAAAHCEIGHPIFEHIHVFAPPEEHRRRHVLRYREMIEARWSQPEVLADFLKKTSICNPFYVENVQKNGYKLFESAHEAVGYSKLLRLFEARASVSTILTTFFCTELRTNLPLEDVFYLAQRHEVLPDFLNALKAIPFWGVITKRKPRTLLVSPLFFFSTRLHVMDAPYKAMNDINNAGDEQKGLEIEYVIDGFEQGHIKTSLFGRNSQSESRTSAAVSWTDAVEELRNLLQLPKVSDSQLGKLGITKFLLDGFTEENDLNLLTQLILDHPDRLPVFMDVLALCEWNDCFQNENVGLKKCIYDNLGQYYEMVLKLFETLLAAQQNIDSALDLYFSSVFKAILPLNKLLALTDHKILMEHLPDYTFYCRTRAEDSLLCRPVNIRCGAVCHLERAEGILTTESFAATIEEFSIQDEIASRIVLKALQHNEADIKKRGQMFGYLAKNINITEGRASILATFPSTENCTYREAAFRMVCVGRAIDLRRSDGAALRRLIEALGDANPFRFQSSSFAERLYWMDFSKKSKYRNGVPEMLDICVLNAETIKDIRNIYLHTNVKFHMRLSNLARIVCRRREDLAEALPTMFEGIVFHAIADCEGKLCMPWVEPNTLWVDKQYAGMYLDCNLQLNKDGTILVTVLQASRSEKFYDLWNFCMLSGYRTTPEMRILLNQSEDYDKLLDALKLKDADLDGAGFQNITRLFEKLLHAPNLNEELYFNQICTMIRNYWNVVSQQELESVIADITEKWLQMIPGKAIYKTYLPNIYASVSDKYGSTSLDRIFSRLCHSYTDIGNAKTFENAMQAINIRRANDAARKADEAIRKQKEAELAARSSEELPGQSEDKNPFDEEIEKLKAMLADENNTTFYIKDISSLVRSYHTVIPKQKMEESIAEVTEAVMQRFPRLGNYMTKLMGLHMCFLNHYLSDSLGIILCRQARQYLYPGIADFLDERIMGEKARPTVFVKDADEVRAAAEKDRFRREFVKLRDIFYHPQTMVKGAAKKISKFIRNYRDIVEAPEMLEAVAELTEAFMKRYEGKKEQISALCDIYVCFAECYQNKDLLLVLCRQGHQYWNEGVAHLLQCQLMYKHKTLFKELCAPDEVPLVDDGLTFSRSLEMVRELLRDPRAFQRDITRKIANLIRDHSQTVPRQEMLMKAAELTEAFIQRYADDEEIEKYLTEIHESFSVWYESVDLSLVLCLQAYQYLYFGTAVHFETWIRASQEFRKFADPELIFDYFMQKERIPLWNELYYTT